MLTSPLFTTVAVTLLGAFAAGSSFFILRRLFAWYFPPTSSMLPSSPVVLGKGEQYFATAIGRLIGEEISIYITFGVRIFRSFYIVGPAPLWKKALVALLQITIEISLFFSPMVFLVILALLIFNWQ